MDFSFLSALITRFLSCFEAFSLRRSPREAIPILLVIPKPTRTGENACSVSYITLLGYDALVRLPLRRLRRTLTGGVTDRQTKTTQIKTRKAFGFATQILSG